MSLQNEKSEGDETLDFDDQDQHTYGSAGGSEIVQLDPHFWVDYQAWLETRGYRIFADRCWYGAAGKL